MLARQIVVTSLFIGLLAGALPARCSAEPTRSTPANVMLEFVLTSAKVYADPFNDVDVDATVTAPDGSTTRVPAFWAGGQTWKLRFASPLTGVHRFRTECADKENKLLHGVEGSFEVVPYTGENPLYRHGPLRVAADRRHLEHCDGTPFLWLADTWWMGLCDRLAWSEEFKTLACDRVDKGFNVVQIVAGLYPDMPAFDERGRNENGFPWESDYGRIRPEYFDMADRRLAHLADAGLVPCIVGAWGYHLPWLGVERMKKHWRYLVARYSVLPAVWCIAGEGEMPYYLAKDKEADKAFQRAGWTEIARYVRALDPYHHLLTIHPSQCSRQTVEDPAVLDFDMLQTGHGDRSSIGPTLKLVNASRAAWPTMPTINSEVCYEGILGTCFDDVQRYMVWGCLLSGNAGHTYGANGIWQLNRQGQPYGKSPHGGTWGATPWDEAMRLPGSKHTGLAKRLLESLPWQRFEPHPEWATVERPRERLNLKQWIWFAEGDPAKDAPAGACYFRHTFNLSEGRTIQRAELRASADDRLTVFLNGQSLGTHAGWNVAKRFVLPIGKLSPGVNVLAIRGENGAAPHANPAGLIAHLELEFADGSHLAIDTDDAWRASRQESPGWNGVKFDDANWATAKVIAPYGAGPWGPIASGDDAYTAPFAAGIERQVRVIYAPTAGAIQLAELEQGIVYDAVYFDPRSGDQTPIARVQADIAGQATVARTGVEGDWVLLLQASSRAAAPISIHPDNPKYFLFRGRTLVLVAASEHYGSVVNRAFDFERYLTDAADKRQTMTRTFLLFREQQSSRNPSSPIKPESPDFITPWPRVGPAKAADGEPIYDLDQWNSEYFNRLRRFLESASRHGIVVELTLFSNTYAEPVWALNPLRASNNVQKIGAIEWQEYTSLKNRPLNERQFAYVDKIIEETSGFDNIYYEICNEPGGGFAGHAAPADVDAWQAEVARVARAALKRLGRTHLVAGSQAFSYVPKFTQPLDGTFASDVYEAVNVHPLPGTVLGGRTYNMGNFMSKELSLGEFAEFSRAAASHAKPVIFDEDNCASIYRDPTGWTIHRKRAWIAAMSLAHYDYIDFSITVGSEAGTKESSAAIRTWFKHLSEFVHQRDLVHARVASGWIEREPANVVSAALQFGNSEWAAYLADAREVTDPTAGEPIAGEVARRLPEGKYRATLISPATGGESPAIRLRGGSEPATIDLPAFRHDVVLRVVRDQ